MDGHVTLKNGEKGGQFVRIECIVHACTISSWSMRASVALSKCWMLRDLTPVSCFNPARLDQLQKEKMPDALRRWRDSTAVVSTQI